jgi:molybdopterin-guanine dinucleotide biosynthesis protein A
LNKEIKDFDISVAKTGTQAHPVFALVRKSVLQNLEAFLAGGGRKIDAWYSSLKYVEVLFDDQPTPSATSTRARS